MVVVGEFEEKNRNVREREGGKIMRELLKKNEGNCVPEVQFGVDCM